MTFDDMPNGKLPRWMDLRFLILLITIIFSSAGYYYTTKHELDDHRRQFIEESMKQTEILQQLKKHEDKDEREREVIKNDIYNKYQERMSFQQSILQTLGKIQGKLDIVVKEQTKDTR